MNTPKPGFTLIEVVVAMAILAATVVVLLGTQNTAMSGFIRARDAVEARQLLEYAIGQAEAAVLSGTLSGAGEFSKRYEGWKWAYESTQSTEDQLGLFQLTVRITGPDETGRPDGFVKEVTYFIYDTSERQ